MNPTPGSSKTSGLPELDGNAQGLMSPGGALTATHTELAKPSLHVRHQPIRRIMPSCATLARRLPSLA